MEDERFSAAALRMRLGRPASPIIFNADRLYGSYAAGALGGTFTGAESTIRDVPVALSEMSGSWRVDKGDLSATATAMVSDRNPEPRFYPMRTNDLFFRKGVEGRILFRFGVDDKVDALIDYGRPRAVRWARPP